MTNFSPSFKLLLAGSALLLVACASGPGMGGAGPYGTGGYTPPPGSAQRDAADLARGHPTARVIVREGPLVGRDGFASPEENARQDAGAYCGSVNLETRVISVQRERIPIPPNMRPIGGVPATEYERVRLSFDCTRGTP